MNLFENIIKCLVKWKFASVITFAVLLVFCSPTKLSGLNEIVLPEVTLKLNKGQFFVSEPILLTITLRNKSNEPQQYGLLDINAGVLKFEILDPNGRLIDKYANKEMSNSAIAWIENESTAVKPERTLSETVLVNDYFDMGQCGKYEIRVGYPIKERVHVENTNFYKIETTGYHTESINVLVVAAELKEEVELANEFNNSLSKHLNLLIPNDDILETYKNVISSSNELYLIELASYYKALYYEQLGEIPAYAEYSTIAVGEYTEFIENYPNSFFLERASQGMIDAKFRNSQEIRRLVKIVDNSSDPKFEEFGAMKILPAIRKLGDLKAIESIESLLNAIDVYSSMLEAQIKPLVIQSSKLSLINIEKDVVTPVINKLSFQKDKESSSIYLDILIQLKGEKEAENIIKKAVIELNDTKRIECLEYHLNEIMKN